MEAYDDEKVNHPPKIKRQNLEPLSMDDSKEKIERQMISPVSTQLPSTYDKTHLQDPRVESNSGIAALGIHPISPNPSQRQRGQRLTTESLNIFNNQRGQSPVKNSDWTGETGGADVQQLAKSEPADPRISPVYTNIDSYNMAAEEYRVHKFFKHGNIKYSPRSYATPKTSSSAGASANDGSVVRTVDMGATPGCISDVKAPVGIRDKVVNQRRRSVFSVLSEDKADMSQCNREFLLKHIGSLEKELRQEREFRRLTEGMLLQQEAVEPDDAPLQNAKDWIWPTKEFRTAGGYPEVLRERLKLLEQQRSVDQTTTAKHCKSDEHTNNEESIVRDPQTNHYSHRNSVEVKNKQQKDRPAVLLRVPDSRATRQNQMRASNERTLTIELSVSAGTVNDLRSLIAGNEPSNPNPKVKPRKCNNTSHPEVGQEPLGVDRGKHSFQQSSYPPVLMEFFYLTTISVKLKLSKKYKTEPSVGTPTDMLWKEALRLKLAFTDFYDFLMASEEPIFRNLSERKKVTSSSFLGFFYFFGGR